MADQWFKNAVVYCLDVETFQDSNDDGVGDFPGLTSRLDYLARLGVTCVWLHPIHPSPNRDDGYDVTDFYGIHPDLGTLGDFVTFMHEADNRGLRVIIDLVVNHTSDEHPWFQAARADKKSPYRDWYVWSEQEPGDRKQGMVFPGVQKSTWDFDEEAGAWYYHRFYDFQPDLNTTNPDVRDEIGRIIAFWVRLGVSGFRVDAAPFIIEQTRPDDPEPPKDYPYLSDLRQHVSWRRGDAIFLAEANVEREELLEYFGDGDRLHMMFDFMLNQRTFLALAREDATPIVGALEAAMRIPPACQWATFLRNHDEIDLGRLSDRERAEVFAVFGPDPEMQLYDRGIRRRLAPMLDGDRRRLEMAYALQATLPGTPVLRYGDEIGMGEDLSLPERNAIRTPMQWDAGANAGFTAPNVKKLVRPIVSDKAYAAEHVNVTAQRRDPASLLAWMERMLHTLRECPEFGTAPCTPVDTGQRPVLALRYEGDTGTMIAITNLGARGCTVDIGAPEGGQEPVEIFADRRYDTPSPDLSGLKLSAHGYRWIRLVQSS